MQQYTIEMPSQDVHFTKHASLAAIGSYLRHHDLFAPIRKRVLIAQKTVLYTPLQKLEDAFIAILTGIGGLVEINTSLRSDPSLQQAFGRSGCAEQSVIQDTLDACTQENVTQMQQALTTIYRTFSSGYRHDYEKEWQVLDVDLTGLPCGKRAEAGSKGYFGDTGRHRGRQDGRVLATHYGELVVERVYDGSKQLHQALPELVEQAAMTLKLDPFRRSRTILRVDAGGGSVERINWALNCGYQYHGKDYSGMRVKKLVASVSEWVTDPKMAGREVGWVESEAPYDKPVRRIAVRCRRKNETWAYGVLVSTLTAQSVLSLMGYQQPSEASEVEALLAYVHWYDQRGGGVETANKDDKQGLGIGKRNKRRLAAQQMVVCLNTLAHNVLVWVRRELARSVPKLARLGLLRLVRDVCHISGKLHYDEQGQLVRIGLNQHHPLARLLIDALRVLLEPLGTHIYLVAL